MTYVELIVVLSIFAIMSSIAIFNYNGFQANVDIKNYASDIALQIVQAQKSSLSGLLPTLGGQITGWKPSYGVYFSTNSNKGADNKNIIYFTDLNNNGIFDSSFCTGECLSKVTITKNNTISKLEIIPSTTTSCTGVVSGNPVTDLDITFKRPDSGTTIASGVAVLSPSNITCAQITVASPGNSVTSTIKVYPSGRIQIN